MRPPLRYNKQRFDSMPSDCSWRPGGQFAQVAEQAVKGRKRPSQLSGSIAGGRGRRAETQHRGAADSRGPFSQSEDAGRIRDFPVIPCIQQLWCGIWPKVASRKPQQTRRSFFWEKQARARHLAVGLGVAALLKPGTSALHHRGAVGERTDRSQEQEGELDRVTNR